MTFTEAAIEVLRLAGKPLHYKKITEISIQKNLLSHVGKTPEITMSSRLATMVRKDRGEAAIVKIKPGVFGLREFDEKTLKAAEGATGHDFELPEASSEAPVAAEVKREAEAKADGAAAEAKADGDAAEAEPKAETRQLPGADVFPEEDDDDVPILSAVAEESSDSEERPGRRKRRRRRKRREPGEGDGRSEGRGERSRERSRERTREAGARTEIEGDWDRTSEDGDLSGLELSDAIAGVLGGGRNRRPRALADVARELVRRGRMSGGAAALAPTLAAAVRGDTARREQEGQRPRFRLDGALVALTDWGMPQDASRAEAEVLRVATRQRQAMRRALLKEMERLPAASSLELLATWLNAEGVVSLRAVRRPGSSSGEFHLAGTYRRGPMSTPVAIFFRRDGAPLTREHVIDVRGSLHHYGDAAAAWLITLGSARSGAREEASVAGAAPVALYDGEALTSAMENLGIGLTRHLVPMLSLDQDLLESLRGPAASRRSRGAADTSAKATDVAESDEVAEATPEAQDAETKDAETKDEEVSEGKRPRRRRRRKRADAETVEVKDETREASAEPSDEEAASDAAPDAEPPAVVEGAEAEEAQAAPQTASEEAQASEVVAASEEVPSQRATVVAADADAEDREVAVPAVVEE